MPWQEQGSGFTTSRGGHISNVPQYEKLKAKYGKARAAAITNSFHHKRGPKRKDEMAKAADDGGASQILVLQGPRRTSVAKYQRGTITQHQEQASLHARKKTSGRRQVAAGTTVAGIGAAAALHPRRIGVNVRDALVHPGAGLDEHRRAAAYGAKAAKIADKGGRAAFLGGAGLAAVGAGRAVYHGSRQNREAQAAQQARRQRNASLAKADHHDAAAAFLGGGAAGSGASAVQAHRRARVQRQGSAKLHEEARDHYRIAENRLQRHSLKPKTAGRIPYDQASLGHTTRELYLGRATDHRAAAMARNAATSGRKAKGRAGAAALLAGGATAAASRRDRTPRYGSVGYR